VKSARKSLIESGFITKDVGSFQRKLNRDGAYFLVNLAWSERTDAGPKISPLIVKIEAPFAPPYKDKKTSYEIKNQETKSRALKLPDICKANEGKKPNLRNVLPEDLKSFPRVKALFTDAANAGWHSGSEADFLNWVGAAVHTNTAKARNPAGMFISIVKERRWDRISQAQEDRARVLIRHFRETEEGVAKGFRES
jgi:hypothetical protein